MKLAGRKIEEELIPLTPQLAIQVVSDALLAAFFIVCAVIVDFLCPGNRDQHHPDCHFPARSSVQYRSAAVACLAGFLFLMPWMLHRASAYALSVMRDWRVSLTNRCVANGSSITISAGLPLAFGLFWRGLREYFSSSLAGS